MKKRYDILLAVFSFSAVALIVFCLGPLDMVFTADAVYRETAIPVIFDAAIDIIQIASFTVAYAVIFYSAYAFGSARIKNQVILFLSSVILLYVGNVVMTFVTERYFDPVLLYYVAGSILLEAAMHGIVIGFGVHISRAEASERKADKNEGFIAFRSASSRFSLISALLVAGGKLLSRVIYDVQIGEPQSRAEIIEMIIYYASDILIGLAVYFIMSYILVSFYGRGQKEKADA